MFDKTTTSINTYIKLMDLPLKERFKILEKMGEVLMDPKGNTAEVRQVEPQTA